MYTKKNLIVTKILHDVNLCSGLKIMYVKSPKDKVMKIPSNKMIFRVNL